MLLSYCLWRCFRLGETSSGGNTISMHTQGTEKGRFKKGALEIADTLQHLYDVCLYVLLDMLLLLILISNFRVWRTMT